MGLVVLGERVHVPDWLAVQVDEGERMVAFDARNLFEVAMPEMQKPLAILRQEPVRQLVVGGIVSTTFPTGMLTAHLMITGNEAELLCEIFGAVAFVWSAPLVSPIGRCSAVARVVDEDLASARVGGVRKYIRDIKVKGL